MPVRQIFFLFKLFSANTYFYLQIYCIDMIFYTCHWILSVIGKLHIWAKKKKAKFPLKIAVKQSKGFQKWLPIAIISLSFLSFLLFHFSPTTFPPTYLELFLFSLLWKNYCEKKKTQPKPKKTTMPQKWRGVSLLAGCDELCSQSHVPPGGWGGGGAPRMGLAIEKPRFSALTKLVLGSVHSCWLQLSWQVTLPGTSIQPEETGGNEQGKISPP